MRRAAIVAPVRTAVATYGGSLRPVAAEKLIAATIKEVLKRSKIDPARLEEVIVAQSYANTEAPCIGRYAVLEADLPIEIPGYQLDRRCGSGLQAILNASMMIQSGAADVVLAGGVESMSNAEYYTTDLRWGKRAGSVTMHDRIQRGRERSQPAWRFGEIAGGMIETAENLAKEYNITRDEADEYAVRSHQRATKAWVDGKFNEELVTIDVPQPKGDPKVFSHDEGYRKDASMETLAKLRPIMKGGIVTAGNASQQNDASAACLVVAEDKLAELGLEPMGYLVGWAAAGCHPATMGIGPVPAVKRLFEKTGFNWDKLDIVELNEAFACQVLAVLKGWGWNDPDKLNINGSGISLGHPIAATGGRILASMLHEMKRSKMKYGLETMCVGSGQGLAAIFERA